MADKINDAVLRDAQYRKGMSIAYFNSVNSAIAILTPSVNEILKGKGDELAKLETIKGTIKMFRDWFIEEHKTYYANNIASQGASYDAKNTIERLNATTNYAELKTVYLALSEDERRDGEIKKVVIDLKQKYEEA